MQRFSDKNEYINSRIEESVFNQFGSDKNYSSLKENDKKLVNDSLKICDLCESLTLADENTCWNCGCDDLQFDSNRVVSVIDRLEI